MDFFHIGCVLGTLGNLVFGINTVKLFLTIWLTVSLIAASIAFAPPPTETQSKSILILNVNGRIDSTLVKSFEDYFDTNPQPPDFLVLNMNSSGGFYLDTLVLARGLRGMENLGTRVYFFVDGTCKSGCYLLASFANQIYATPNSTVGFGHSYEEVKEIYPQIQAMLYANSRIEIVGNLFVTPPMNLSPEVCVSDGNEFVMIYPYLDGCADSLETLLSSIQSDSDLFYTSKTVTLDANVDLGSP